ncbi:MAG: hypothetical protein E5V19_00880 [Mesorhizobium sp.]|nr:MAG: hypothetical protein E5V19_00880 [Mesorhizobium sp.]
MSETQNRATGYTEGINTRRTALCPGMRLHIRHLRGEEELRHASVLGSSDDDASIALARTTRQIEEWRVVLYQRRKGLSCADLNFVLRSNRQHQIVPS